MSWIDDYIEIIEPIFFVGISLLVCVGLAALVTWCVDGGQITQETFSHVLSVIALVVSITVLMSVIALNARR